MAAKEENVKEEVPRAEESEMYSMIKKMQVKLDHMESKLDTLLRQSKPPAYKSREYSKPYRDDGRSREQRPRRYEARKEETSGDSKFFHGRPFEKKTGGKSSFRPGNPDGFKGGNKGAPKKNRAPRKPGKKG